MDIDLPEAKAAALRAIANAYPDRPEHCLRLPVQEADVIDRALHSRCDFSHRQILIHDMRLSIFLGLVRQILDRARKGFGQD